MQFQGWAWLQGWGLALIGRGSSGRGFGLEGKDWWGSGVGGAIGTGRALIGRRSVVGGASRMGRSFDWALFWWAGLMMGGQRLVQFQGWAWLQGWGVALIGRGSSGRGVGLEGKDGWGSGVGGTIGTGRALIGRCSVVGGARRMGHGLDWACFRWAGLILGGQRLIGAVSGMGVATGMGRGFDWAGFQWAGLWAGGQRLVGFRRGRGYRDGTGFDWAGLVGWAGLDVGCGPGLAGD